MRVALLLGLLLVAAPILSADSTTTFTWQDSSKVAPSTGTTAYTKTVGANTIWIWSWVVGTDAHFYVETNNKGDVYLGFKATAFTAGTKDADVDIVKITVESNAVKLYDGFTVAVSDAATKAIKFTPGGANPPASDTTVDFVLTATTAGAVSWITKTDNTGAGGFKVQFKRPLAITAGQGGDVTLTSGATANKMAYVWKANTAYTSSTINTAEEIAADNAVDVSDSKSDWMIKALRGDFAGTFTDITAGLTKAKFSVATTAAAGATASVSVKGAAYKDGTDARVGLQVTVPSGDAWVVLMVGGSDTQPGNKADMVKLKFSSGVVTIVGEATSAAASAADKAFGAVASWTSPAVNWKFYTDASDTSVASYKYTTSGTIYTVDLKRALAASSPVSPGANVAIDTTKDQTFGIIASTSDITVADGAAPTNAAGIAYAKATVTVGATTDKDPSTGGGSGTNSSGSGSKNSAIVAFSLMLLATLGLFAF